MMTDWQTSLESMAGSLDGLQRRIASYDPKASAQSNMGYVQVTISFRGNVAFEIDSSIGEPDAEADLSIEIAEAYNRALNEVRAMSQQGIYELFPGLRRGMKDESNGLD
jgi:DNA-binding protein YbaB